MNMSVEKKKYPSALPTNWSTREETARKSQNQLTSTGKVDVYYYSRGVRNDASLVPPIRQTASIFKQPVTIYKTQEGKVKDLKHGNQEKPKQEGADKADGKYGSQDKPKQLFWEKRLEGLRACDPDGYEFDAMDLPKSLRPVGPYITEETLLQSVATALHVSSQPVTGQTGSKTALEKNPGVFLNPDQPLVQAVSIADEDIKRQEDRVALARKKLQEALRGMPT
ncbi:methyl-CpG-binding domain protein 3-like isoform X1 [Vespa mandarinia]|uniref:methyl-CpG-binding domain protein 3-like isoform X1 n=1 Tax=Vespa mandarinia TaxID=7446 RepID=UPI001607BE40|nr:methyl-CpG-binding domain protein 3-like isoform X1 [Vespa mandarinia]XP_046812904.1 methyl-CpG-binding domain protein 3 isoform X1 [Vespa crabro]XP_047365715.1 methyl-CpG-binding domain protein 3 isoform X1 [Vespa velutina]